MRNWNDPCLSECSLFDFVFLSFTKAKLYILAIGFWVIGILLAMDYMNSPLSIFMMS